MKNMLKEIEQLEVELVQARILAMRKTKIKHNPIVPSAPPPTPLSTRGGFAQWL